MLLLPIATYLLIKILKLFFSYESNLGLDLYTSTSTTQSHNLEELLYFILKKCILVKGNYRENKSLDTWNQEFFEALFHFSLRHCNYWAMTWNCCIPRLGRLRRRLQPWRSNLKQPSNQKLSKLVSTYGLKIDLFGRKVDIHRLRWSLLYAIVFPNLLRKYSG